MTTLQYMQKQLEKHKTNLHRAIAKKAPEEEIESVKNKIGYYETAISALAKISTEE